MWEMHPDTDEFFYILEGEFEITLLQNEQPEHFVAEAGSAVSGSCGEVANLKNLDPCLVGVLCIVYVSIWCVVFR